MLANRLRRISQPACPKGSEKAQKSQSCGTYTLFDFSKLVIIDSPLCLCQLSYVTSVALTREFAFLGTMNDVMIITAITFNTIFANDSLT